MTGSGNAGNKTDGQERPYHHGDLRRALLDAAIEAIAKGGPASVSLRGLARQVGVSHAAPAHHFGDKTGLLTAVATEGYRLLGESLRDAFERTGSFLEIGVAYVVFAVQHPAHFNVMFRPDLYDLDDPQLSEARAATRRMLYAPLRQISGDDPGFDGLHAGIAAWSLVHGLATLCINENLPPELGDDPERIARSVASYLFRPLPGVTES